MVTVSIPHPAFTDLRIAGFAFSYQDAGADIGFVKGGGTIITRCLRQCIGRVAPISPREAGKKKICLHFSVIRIGSRGTFVLCTGSSRCTRIAGPGAAMCFVLAQISLTNVIRT